MSRRIGARIGRMAGYQISGGGGGGSPPSSLTYSSNPATYTEGTAISSNTPSVTGTVTSYSVSPALPGGLSLNTATGVITGTPTLGVGGVASAVYVVTAANSDGSTTCDVTIAVTSLPSSLGAVAWFDPTTGYSGGTWTDNISGYTVANATSAEQPTTTTIGGHTVLDFDRAASQKLNNTSSGLAALIDATADYSACFYSKADALLFGGLFGSVIGVGTSASSTRSIFNGQGASGGTSAESGLRRNTVGGSTAGANYATTARYTTITHSGGVYNSWMNGTASMSAVNSSVADVGTLDTFSIGALRYNGSYVHHWDGQVGDVVIFDRVLSAGDRSSIEAWLAARYA